MKISVVKETAPGESRVLVLPKEVSKIVEAGNEVCVEKNAGLKIFIYDRDYEEAGAKILTNRAELFEESDLVIKLKAPTIPEFNLLKKNILFSMLHHEQNPIYVYHLGRKKAKAIEIESIINDAGERFIDATDITGEAGVLYAIQHLKKTPQDSKALVLGYGRVGSGAINMCNKLGMNIKILRKGEYNSIDHFIKKKDLLINAIAWPKEERENKKHLVTKEMVDLMNPNGVILDLAVDFPNPIETCRPTTLSNPYYIERGKTHIGIYGYPGLVPISSSQRYSKQALPLILNITNNGGLEKIHEKDELGKYISRAIVDPEKKNWETLKPKEFESSFIE